MSNKVIDAAHKLAAASRQAGGITFTDKNGNISDDNDEYYGNTEDEEPANNTHDKFNKPIAIWEHAEEEPNMDQNEHNTLEKTGVTEIYQDTTYNTIQTIEVTENTFTTITGVKGHDNVTT